MQLRHEVRHAGDHGGEGHPDDDMNDHGEQALPRVLEVAREAVDLRDAVMTASAEASLDVGDAEEPEALMARAARSTFSSWLLVPLATDKKRMIHSGRTAARSRSSQPLAYRKVTCPRRT